MPSATSANRLRCCVACSECVSNPPRHDVKDARTEILLNEPRDQLKPLRQRIGAERPAVGTETVELASVRAL